MKAVATNREASVRRRNVISKQYNVRRRHALIRLAYFGICALFVASQVEADEVRQPATGALAPKAWRWSADERAFASSPFKLLAVLPADKATKMSRELDEAISLWQLFVRRLKNSRLDAASNNFGREPFGPERELHWQDIALNITHLPLTNDTLQVLGAVCGALEDQSPTLLVSFLEPVKTYYMSIIAQTTDTPLLSMTGAYEEQPYVYRPRLVQVQLVFCSSGTRDRFTDMCDRVALHLRYLSLVSCARGARPKRAFRSVVKAARGRTNERAAYYAHRQQCVTAVTLL